MPTPTAQSTIEIAADPELVYELVSNLDEVPKWAAETDRCRWVDGADRAAVGAKFRGRNRHKGRVWATMCRVTHAEPGRHFGFQVYVAGAPTASWRYRIEPAAGGCRVTESTVRTVPRPIALVVNWALGIADRDAHNQRNIERSLVQLKTYAEARATRPA